jgi:hypothetical protein
MSHLSADNYVERLAATLQKVQKKAFDNVLREHPTLDWLRASAKTQSGETVRIPLRMGLNGATQKTDRSATTPTNTTVSGLASAVFDWAAPISTPVRVPWLDLEMNSGGDTRIVDLLEAHTTAAFEDQRAFLATRLHVAGTQVDAGITGQQDGDVFSLDVLIGNSESDEAHGIDVGGIRTYGSLSGAAAQRAVAWQSVRQTVEGGSYRKALRDLVREVSIVSGGKRPTHVLAGQDFYAGLEDELQSVQTITQVGGTVETNFSEIKVDGVTVRLDPDMGAQGFGNRAYALHLPSLHIAQLNSNFLRVSTPQGIEGTLDKIVYITSVLQLGINERRANGLVDYIVA